MGQWKGSRVINGKTYWWSNWTHDQIMLQLPMYKIPDMLMPDDLLADMFDNSLSGELMPMPKEILN